MIDLASESHAVRVETSILNDVIMDAVAMNPTPTHNGNRLKYLLHNSSSNQAANFCCVCK